MFHRWAALALVLALCAVPTKQAAGQQAQQPRGRKLGVLGQNYPNPFNPETRFPFRILCEEGSTGEHVASLRVYNVLAQLVAIPVLEGQVGIGRPLSSLKIPCGDYVAYWDGKVLGTGKEAASGVYLFELIIDGQRDMKKMFVAK